MRKVMALLMIGLVAGCLVGCNKPDPKPDFDVSKVVVAGGEDFRNAKETIAVTGSGNNQGTTVNYPKTNWKTYDGNCNGFVGVVYRMKDGSIKGGKFDWLPQNPTTYHWGFKHVYDGYKGHTAPQDGSDAWVFIFSIDKKERSNFVKFVWKK